jgi:peptide/nickel transport system substrate-binding protein
MQNRFTVKDFLYMTLGLVICCLIGLNILKTNREVEALKAVDSTLASQGVTLGKLEGAITTLSDGMSGGMRLDPALLERLIAAGASQVPGSNSGGSGAEPSAPRPENAAEHPSYRPGYDIQFAMASDAVNRRGLPQRWIPAADAELPPDFSPGDTIVISWATEPQTLTPMIFTDQYARLISYEVMEPLCHINLDAPFNLTPGLARSWDVTEDGMEITFHLFGNATWSDGRPVTADDVIFTWDLVNNEKVLAARYRAYTKPNVESYEKIDEHTVRFRMRQPHFDAVGICGNLIDIMPKHIYGDYSEDVLNESVGNVMVGSGPFVLERWDRGREIVLARNENYWGPKPAVERLVFRINTNELSNLQEFWARNIDVVFRPTAEQYAEYADSDRMRERNGEPYIYYSPLGGYAYIGYNLRKPMFADKRTRQALTMLIDRQEIIDTLLMGQGMLVSGPFYFNGDQNDKSIEPWPFDPDRALSLLREVGWEDTDGDGVLDMDLNGDGLREPFEFTFLMSSGPKLSADLQRFVQDALKRAGIKVNLDQLEWAVYLDRVLTREFDVMSMAWSGSPEGNPYQIWHSTSEANQGSNHVGFNNARADELIELGQRTIDYDARMKIWHEFHALLHEEQPYTFIYGRPERLFIDQRFRRSDHDYRPYYPSWWVPSAEQVR